MTRAAWAEVDLDALAHNVRALRAVVAPSALWAVVKADGYGHGAVDVARTALAAGASGLCVALVGEGVELRDAGVDAPILLLSEPPSDEVADVIAHGLTPTVYSVAWLGRLSATVGSSVAVHVNVDSGMQRVGVATDDAAEFIRLIQRDHPALHVAGVYTHLACADQPASAANRIQLDRFEAVLADVDSAALGDPVIHIANSAAALALPEARRSLVRVGIAMYGISPGPGVDHLCGELQPVMSLRARVAHVKRVRAGSSISYGWRHRFAEDTTVATLPIGYADGVPRRLGTLPDRTGADVLLAGHRCPIVGVVTMDQCMVDVGELDVVVGDEAVLIGRQGDEHIRAEEWAERLDTIGYEIVCGIGARVPRVVRATGESP